MADQMPSDAVSVAGEAELSAVATQPPAVYQGHHGRPISWVAVSVIMVGFTAGGAGLVAGPTWWLFWLGAALAAVGGVLALGSGIFNDWY